MRARMHHRRRTLHAKKKIRLLARPLRMNLEEEAGRTEPKVISASAIGWDSEALRNTTRDSSHPTEHMAYGANSQP